MTVIRADNASEPSSVFDLQPPDEAAQLSALTHELTVAHGFTLIFAVCDAAAQRERLMTIAQERLSERRILAIQVPEGTRNLLNVLRERIDDKNSPDAVFVYGLERWIGGQTEAKSLPLILNLNAARNHFSGIVPCPLVLWLPAYVLALIARGAPDFMSIRSGVHLFPVDREDLATMRRMIGAIGWTGARGLAPEDRDARVQQLNDLLNGYRTLPEGERDAVAEASLLRSLMILHMANGEFEIGEMEARECLVATRGAFHENDPKVATCLNDLAWLHYAQGRYSEAEPLFRQSLNIYRSALGEDNPTVATASINIAECFRRQGRFAEAEPYYVRAVEIGRTALGMDHLDTVTSLVYLAGLYHMQGRHADAERLYLDARSAFYALLPAGHPDIGWVLNNLAALYDAQGRHREAMALYGEALEIVRATLGPDHPDTQVVENNYRTSSELALSTGR